MSLTHPTPHCYRYRYLVFLKLAKEKASKLPVIQDLLKVYREEEEEGREGGWGKVTSVPLYVLCKFLQKKLINEMWVWEIFTSFHNQRL